MLHLARPLLLATIGLVLANGCAQTVPVQPRAAYPSADRAPRELRVSLYIDQIVGSYRRNISRFSDEGGVGAVTADFALGPPLSETIRQSANRSFEYVSMTGSVACDEDTDFLLVVEFSRSPRIEINWRRAGGVGGRSTADLPMKVSSQACSGGAIEERAFVATGSSKLIKTSDRRPGQREFAPGIEAALADLSEQLGEVFLELPPAP